MKGTRPFRKKKSTGDLLFLIIGLVFFLGSCAGTEQAQTVDTALQESIRVQGEQLENVRSLITKGSPRSLDIALSTLWQNDLDATELGAEYEYIIGRLYHMVYPYLEYAEFDAQPPADSLYSSIFSRISEGRVPDLAQEQTTFLSSLAAGTAVLNAAESDEIEKAGGITSYLVKINPQSVLALFLHGRYLERQDRPAEAESLYRQAVEIDNSCYPARLGLVRTYYKLGRTESAASYIETLLLEFPEQKEVLEAAVEVYLQSGELQKTDSLLSRAIIRYPEASFFLRKRVELLERQNKHEQAARIARVIEEREGDTPETLLVRIKSLIREKQYQSALSLVQNSMSRFPDFEAFPSIYGSLLKELGRQEEAYTFFQKELEENPGNLSIVASLLDAAIGLKKWEDAALYIEELLPQRENAAIYAQAVQIYRRLGQTGKALEYADVLKEKYSDTVTAAETYLNLLIQMERQSMVQDYISSMKGRSRNPEVRSILYYYESLLVDDEERKLQLLQSALLENIQNFSALRDIALLYESMGEYKKAIRYLRQALTLREDNEALQQKMRELQSKIR